MRDVERVLQRGPQGGIEVAPEDRFAGTAAFDCGEGERGPGRFGIGLAPRPHEPVLLDGRVGWDVPRRLGPAVLEPGNAEAPPAAVVGPAVVAALEQAIAGHPSEGQRVVAVATPVEDDGRRARRASEHHERSVHEGDGQRPAAQLRGPGHRIPPPLRKRDGVRPDVHTSIMPRCGRRVGHCFLSPGGRRLRPKESRRGRGAISPRGPADRPATGDRSSGRAVRGRTVPR